MKNSIIPTIRLVGLIVISITLLYQHFFDDGITGDGFEIKSRECYKNNEEVDCYVYD